MATIRGLKFMPGKRVEPFEVERQGDRLDAFYKAIGCSLVEFVTITPTISLIIDEEGRCKDEPDWNRAWQAGPGMVHEGHVFMIAGTALAVSFDRLQPEAELESLTVVQAEMLFSLEVATAVDRKLSPEEQGRIRDEAAWEPSHEQLIAWLEQGVRWPSSTP